MREFRNAQLRTRRGLTLIELLAVVTILAILSSMAIPRFSRSLARQRLEWSARRVIADLHWAGRLARTQARTQIVRFDPPRGAYTLMGVTDPDRPIRTYEVALADEPYLVTLLSASFGGDGDVRFDPFGRPDSGGVVTLAVGSEQIQVELSADSGAARIR